MSLENFEKMIQNGETRGYYYLGYALVMGEYAEGSPLQLRNAPGKGTVEVDFERGVTAFRTGMDLGDADCHYGLGLCYERGLGVEADPKQAMELYLTAGDMGVASAFMVLGDCYLQGKGVPKSLAKATRAEVCQILISKILAPENAERGRMQKNIFDFVVKNS